MVSSIWSADHSVFLLSFCCAINSNNSRHSLDTTKSLCLVIVDMFIRALIQIETQIEAWKNKCPYICTLALQVRRLPESCVIPLRRKGPKMLFAFHSCI